jgi:F-type H+-transporting ATPase subunit b
VSRTAARFAAVAAVAAIAPAGVASAAILGAAGGGEGMKEIVLELLNLLLLGGALVYFGRKSIQAYFAERRRGIEHEVAEAAELLAQAERRYAEWQRKLLDLDRELEEIRATARDRARDERARILAEAESAAERMRRDAGLAIEQELRRARTRLRDEAADLAVELAQRMLVENVSEADQTRLLDEFIDRIGESPAPGGAPAAAGR